MSLEPEKGWSSSTWVQKVKGRCSSTLKSLGEMQDDPDGWYEAFLAGHFCLHLTGKTSQVDRKEAD